MLIVRVSRRFTYAAIVVLGVFGADGTTAAGFAQSTTDPEAATTGGDLGARNRDIVGIVSGSYAGANIKPAADLAAMLDGRDGLRIFPIVGRGALQNVDDLLHERGVDVAIVQSDVLAHIKTASTDKNIDRKLSYITKLFNQELHIIAGEKYSSIADLAGKTVSFGPPGSGTRITATAVFEALDVDVQIVGGEVYSALRKVKSGEIAALAFVGGKPAAAIAGLRREDGFRLLPVRYVEPLREAYLPAKFTADDYAGLLVRGERIASVSVGSVMITRNRRPSAAAQPTPVGRFITALVRHHEELKTPPRHRKWRDLNLNVTLPGWTRHPQTEMALAGRDTPPVTRKIAAKPATPEPGPTPVTRKLAAKPATPEPGPTPVTKPATSTADQKPGAKNPSPTETTGARKTGVRQKTGQARVRQKIARRGTVPLPRDRPFPTVEPERKPFQAMKDLFSSERNDIGRRTE